MLHAMRDVIAQDLLLRAPQRRAHRRDLGHNVDAVSVVLDHAGETANLTLDTAQPPQSLGLAALCHDRYIPPQGILWQGVDMRVPISTATRIITNTRPTTPSIPCAG